jgi:hypothetical protein
MMAIQPSVVLAQDSLLPIPIISFAPRTYVCSKIHQPLSIDGNLAEQVWQQAPWSDAFVDIEGPSRPEPRQRTRMKMLWDDSCLYIGAQLDETDVWARLLQRDTVIFHDNDFEVFIDPDGDSHQYYEFEINALNTGWDLLLIRPYRDGAPAVNGWDIQGLRTAVSVQGTINNPSDRDQGWSVELAMPWSSLKECAQQGAPPSPGDYWRMNFSRVEWRTRVENGRYLKEINPATGRPFPEDNWIWSPQGVINMHYPEMWGFVQFSARPPASAVEPFAAPRHEQAKWILRQAYYKQQHYFITHKTYCHIWSELGIAEPRLNDFVWPPRIKCTWNQYEIQIENKQTRETWTIHQDGWVGKQ